MKCLSFGCSPTDEIYIKQILPALLKGVRTNWKEGKTQTIRSAQNDTFKCFWCNKIVKWENAESHTDKHHHQLRVRTYDKKEKQPRFKVGEEARLYWKQRSQYKEFCSKCGKQQRDDIIVDRSFGSQCCKEFTFNKILGEVKMTEVFKIIMYKDKHTGKYQYEHIGKLDDWAKSIRPDRQEDLAKRDGFNSAQDMFNYFDNNYDLSTPKKFYVYRWG